MRFIRSDSLKQAIDEFHAGTKPGSRYLAVRTLLGRFIVSPGAAGRPLRRSGAGGGLPACDGARAR
jgi:hypothetical protein